MEKIFIIVHVDELYPPEGNIVEAAGFFLDKEKAESFLRKIKKDYRFTFDDCAVRELEVNK